MNKFLVQILTGVVVLGLVTGTAWAGSDCLEPQKGSVQPTLSGCSVTIKCDVEALVFSGSPNETKTGEVHFVVQTRSGCKKYQVTVCGLAFENDSSLLDTEYQPENSKSWYRSGVPFTMLVFSGQNNSIRFRVKTGPKISSQQAGTYAAKFSFVAIPYQ